MTYSSQALDGLIAGYVSGSLPLPVQVLVEAHLELSPRNHRWVGDLEAVAGTFLDGIEPVDVPGRDHKLDRIFATAPDAEPESDPGLSAFPMGSNRRDHSGLPASILRYAGRPLADVPWKTRLPGIREWRIGSDDGFVTSLFCLRAGHGLPPHTHRGTEMTLVLHGGFTDTTGHYGVGDVSIADDLIDHRPLADDDGDCIGFVVSNASLRLTGRLGRLLAPFLPG
ncbi:ChrR family anti-sigma-E factor [Amorphus sp. MBR-141]